MHYAIPACRSKHQPTGKPTIRKFRIVAPDETPSPLHLRHQATNLPTKTPNLLTGRAWNGGGGDEEDRTPDLGIANAALSQLSYVPTVAG